MLKKSKRYDLIEKYGHALMALGVFDNEFIVSDQAGFFTEMA